MARRVDAFVKKDRAAQNAGAAGARRPPIAQIDAAGGGARGLTRPQVVVNPAFSTPSLVCDHGTHPNDDSPVSHAAARASPVATKDFE